MKKQDILFTALAATVATVALPALPAQAETLLAQMKRPVSTEAPVEAETKAVEATESEAVEAGEAPAEVSDETTAAPEATEAAENTDAPSPSGVMAAPVPTEKPSDAKVAGPAFSMPNVKLPFALSLMYRPETATLGGTGFTGSGQVATPTQFTYPTVIGAGWSGTAEIGIPFITLGARTTQYGSFGTFGTHDASNIAASQPYYWPESSWTTYVRAFGLRAGYLSEQFNAATKHPGAVGSFVGGIDSGFSLFGLAGVDYHLLAGWGVSGQNVDNLQTSHVPVDADASVYVNIGPVNLRAGYVARATFTGDPGSFLTIVTNPNSIVESALNGDTTTLDTVNVTRLGTYTGPYFGVGFTF